MTRDYKNMWVVYITECRNSFLYTGITNKLEDRIKKHNLGKGARFTQRNKPCKLLWHEHHVNRPEAQKREYEIKGWSRKKKLELTKTNSSLCSEC